MATVIEKSVPPLGPGDKLTRAEFLRRWEAHPEIKNAELIGGIVYMASPVSVDHGRMESAIGGLFFNYVSATPGTDSGHNTTSYLLDDTPQPDLYLRLLTEYGGRSSVSGSYLQGVPELLAEICRSSTSHDLHVKLDLYQTAKVPEYLAILLFEREIRWHVLANGQYQLLTADADGLFRSRIFPGLWLDGKALLEGTTQQVLARLQEGLRSPEYERFPAELASRKTAHTEKA